MYLARHMRSSTFEMKSIHSRNFHVDHSISNSWVDFNWFQRRSLYLSMYLLSQWKDYVRYAVKSLTLIWSEPYKKIISLCILKLLGTFSQLVKNSSSVGSSCDAVMKLTLHALRFTALLPALRTLYQWFRQWSMRGPALTQLSIVPLRNFTLCHLIWPARKVTSGRLGKRKWR